MTQQRLSNLFLISQRKPKSSSSLFFRNLAAYLLAYMRIYHASTQRFPVTNTIWIWSSSSQSSQQGQFGSHLSDLGASHKKCSFNFAAGSGRCDPNCPCWDDWEEDDQDSKRKRKFNLLVTTQKQNRHMNLHLYQLHYKKELKSQMDCKTLQTWNLFTKSKPDVEC